MKSEEYIFKSIIDRKYYITCGYARNCLFLLLKALGIGPGDEVIVPAYTCLSIPKTIKEVGATPVFVDCDYNSVNMSVDIMKDKITQHTKLIYVIHTYGVSSEISKICAIAKSKKIYVAEDISHSYYVEYQNRRLGTFGDFAIISFTKLFLNYQGALIATNKYSIYKRMLNLKSLYKKNNKWLKYLPLYIIRFIGSYFERDGAIVTLFIFRILYLILKVKKNYRDISGDLDYNFFYMGRGALFLTKLGIKRNNKNNHLLLYRKFKQSKIANLPTILNEQTLSVPFHMGGFVRRKAGLHIVFSLSTWSNIHKLGEYPQADIAYANFRIFSKIYIKIYSLGRKIFHLNN